MDKPISKKELRKFSIVIGVGFPIIIGFLIPLLHGQSFRLWTVYFGIISLILGLTYPRGLKFPYILYVTFGNFISLINGPIIIGTVYVLLILPIALIMRVFSYDPLKIKKTKKSTYRLKNIDHKLDMTKIF